VTRDWAARSRRNREILAIAGPCSAPAPPKAPARSRADISLLIEIQADRASDICVALRMIASAAVAGQSEGCGHFVHRRRRECRVEHDLATGKLVPSRPTHHIGIGIGRLPVTVAVSTQGPARAGTIAVRCSATPGGLVSPSERAAAGADRQHFNRRETDR